MNTTINTLSSLQEKLAKLTAANEYSNKSADEILTPFPLESLLIIFNKAHYECMIDYMQGFKLLTNWLSPIESQEDFVVDLAIKYPMLNSYATQRVSKILGIEESIIIESMISILSYEGDTP